MAFKNCRKCGRPFPHQGLVCARCLERPLALVLAEKIRSFFARRAY